MDTLFISDLHLAEERPHTTAAFLVFLEQTAAEATTLYILGDLFDAWIGDDDDRPLADVVAAGLARLAAHGTKLYFQHGNRDFLLGEAYAGRCGMSLLPEIHNTKLGSRNCLLAHGDQFCLEDTGYQAFRTQVRHADWQAHFLARSLVERRAIAADLRARSREANSLKAADIMDVTPDRIEGVLVQYQADLLIHGHTHRPARHPLIIAGQAAERCVLGEWEAEATFARWSPAAGLSLEKLALI
jgi:UDP-2,3-diacylglucosamine hydrolase